MITSSNQSISRSSTAIIQQNLAKVARTESWARQIDLSDREVECLTWAARGKTSAEIAQIVGTSKRNVDFHIETACRKLECSHTRASRGESRLRAA